MNIWISPIGLSEGVSDETETILKDSWEGPVDRSSYWASSVIAITIANQPVARYVWYEIFAPQVIK
jgi:hypothetical protein